MSIQTLPKEVIAKLRSGVAVTSVGQCVDELLQNAIDAEATCVAVCLDLPFHKVQVVDNGRGIGKNDLSLLGERYSTSKCHSLSDLQTTSYYGHRGEAVASICDVSQSVTIVTKARNANITYIKSFCNDGCSVDPASVDRPSCGTTVTICGFLSKLPVRQAMTGDVLEVDRVRRCIEALAIAHPEISFSLHDDASDAWCLRLPKTASAPSKFMHLFGTCWSGTFKPFFATDGQFTLKGFFAIKRHRYKNLQFLYVHRRRIVDSKVQQVINQQYAKAPGNLKDEDPKEGGDAFSPEKSSGESWPVFILEIECPRELVDIGLHPSKTMVQFQHHNELLDLAKRAVSDFLSAHFAATSPCLQAGDHTGTLQSAELAIASPHISVHNCKHAILSLPAKRPLQFSVQKEPGTKDGLITPVSNDVASPPKYTVVMPLHRIQGQQAPEVTKHVSMMSSQTRIGLSSAAFCGTTPLGRLLNKRNQQERMTKALDDLKKFSRSARHHRQVRNVNAGRVTIDGGLTSAIHSVDVAATKHRPTPVKERPTSLPAENLAGTSEIPAPSLPKRICITTPVQQKTSENCTNGPKSSGLPFPDVTQPVDTTAPTQGFEVSVLIEASSVANASDIAENESRCSDGPTRCDLSADRQALVTNPAQLPVSSVIDDSLMLNSCQTSRTTSESDVQQFSGGSSLPCAQSKATCLPEDMNLNCFSDTVSVLKLCSPFTLHPKMLTQQEDFTGEPRQTNGEAKVPKSQDMWITAIDPLSKRNIYIHSASGHSYFGQPPSSRDDSSFGNVIPGRPLNLDTVTDLSHRLAASALPSRPWRSGDHESKSNGKKEVRQLPEGTIESLFQTWKNPVFKVDPLEVIVPTFNIGNFGDSECSSQVFNMMSRPYVFTKDIFKSLNVIAQVDQKFILCSVGNLPSEDSILLPIQPKLLVLFDQHAVHERIRLEDLIAAATVVNHVDEGSLSTLNSSALDQPLCVSLPANVVRIGLAYKACLLLKGLEISESDDVTLQVHKVPVCFIQREASEVRMKRPSVITGLVQNLICDLVQMLETTGTLGSTMPKVVLDVLKSQACHGAVKFGECLDLEEIRQLMEKLSHCQLPFYCAHGRPNVVPLIDFGLVQSADEKMKPNLWKLTTQLIT